MTRHFGRLLEVASLPPRQFHDLHHTCAALLLAQGVHARDIMETLGNSRIGTTMDLHAHVQEPGRRAVAEQMDAAFAGMREDGTELQAGTGRT